MKRNLLIMSCMAIVLATGSGLAADPKDAAGGGMAIVENGRPAATLVVPDKPTPTAAMWPVPTAPKWTTQDTAALLQDYIQKVSGAKLLIVRESEAPQGNLILVGDTKLGREHGLNADKLPEEGYRLLSFAGGIGIVGEISPKGIDRGTLFGVYDFLERVAGVRWYFPGEIGTIIPKHDSLTVGNLDVTNSPRFAVRLGGVSHYASGLSRKWHPVLRYGRRQGFNANHTAWEFVAAGKEHPEYMAITPNGKRALPEEGFRGAPYLCYSEPGLLDEHLKRIDHYFATGDSTRWPGKVSTSDGNDISFGPRDGSDICRCPRCQAEVDLLRGQHGSGSNYIMGFVSRLGVKLKERHPDAVIWTLVYSNYLLPPDRVTVPDNVGITLCIIPTSIQMAHPLVWRRNTDLIEAWYKILGKRRDRIIVWDYFCYPNGSFVAPTEVPHVLAELIRYLEPRSLGIFNNGFNPRRGGEPRLYLTYRMVWLMHQLLWDPSVDVDQLGEQYCRDLFGPAAPQMLEFYKLLEERWEKVEWESMPTTFRMDEGMIYKENYPLHVVKSLEVMLETAFTKAPEDRIYHRRLTWFADKAFRPFLNRARSFHLQEMDDQWIRGWEKENSWELPEDKNMLVEVPELWLFRTDPDKAGEKERWFDPGKKGAPWKPISTHRFWDSSLEGARYYEGDGWYALDLVIPPAPGKKVWLTLGAVDENYTLWVNGKYIADNLDKGTTVWDKPIKVEITGKYKAGEKSHLVVRVKNTRRAGGIWRPARIIAEK